MFIEYDLNIISCLVKLRINKFILVYTLILILVLEYMYAYNIYKPIQLQVCVIEFRCNFGSSVHSNISLFMDLIKHSAISVEVFYIWNGIRFS